MEQEPRKFRPLLEAIRVTWKLLRASVFLGALGVGSVAASRTPVGRRCVEYTEYRCRSMVVVLVNTRRNRQDSCPASTAAQSACQDELVKVEEETQQQQALIQGTLPSCVEVAASTSDAN
jgi:hypothetical protein